VRSPATAFLNGRAGMRGGHFDANANPQYFVDPNALNNGVATDSNSPPVSGRSRERNYFVAMATSTSTTA